MKEETNELERSVVRKCEGRFAGRHLSGNGTYSGSNRVFDYDIGDQRYVIMDLSDSHLWDDSAVAAIDKIVYKIESKGVPVRIVGLNASSSELASKLRRRLSAH